MSLDKIRNFGIIAHIDAGKTTTTERVLFYTRRIHRVGNVDEGTTTTDWYSEEIRRGITIFSAAVTAQWRGHTLNLIDTPGHVDFTAEVERSLRVLDGAVVVFDGVNGVEAQSETVWRQADRYRVPRLVYVNKMDRPGASFDRTLESIREKLKATPVPVTIPWGAEAELHGAIDLLRMKGLTFEGERGERVVEHDLDGPLRSEAELYRQQLIETVAEFDDGALQSWMDGKPVPPETLLRAIRKGTLEGRIVPAYAGTSLHNLGVQPVIDGVVEFLPSPLDFPEVKGKDPEGKKEVKFDLRRDTRLCALAFKTATDQHGELAYVRLYTGTLRSGEAVFNPRLGRMERPTRLFRMFAKDREAIDSAGPGEIVAVIGLKETVTGDTLCDRRNPVVLESMHFPEPVVSVVIEPKTSADKEKLDDVLRRLAKDDPTFRVSADAETGQTLIHAMGELHAEILLFRITNDFKVPASTGEPRVAYRESLSSVARAERKEAIRAGEKTLFGHVVVEVRPNRSSFAPRYVQEIDGALEKELRRFLPAISEGLISAAGSGPIAGYPMIYLDVALVGSSVTAESDERAYSAAAVAAFRKACESATGVLHEPHMKFDVTVPDAYVGDVINDLNRRAASIDDMISAGGAKTLRGTVALSKMFGYTTTLRSLTQGRGQHILEPHDFRAVPPEEVKRRFGDFV